MKKNKSLLLMILLLLFVCPFIVKADVADLELSYDRFAKLGGDAQYTFSIRQRSEYEYYVEYDKQYLKFEGYQGITTQHIGFDDDEITAIDNNGKITIKKKNDVSSYGVTLIFTTLKEGTTKLVVKSDSKFIDGEPINISTEIINTNKKCEKCPEVKECEKCPEVKECKKCPEVKENSKSSSDNIVLYVALGLLVIVNIVTIILALKSIKLNKKSTE